MSFFSLESDVVVDLNSFTAVNVKMTKSNIMVYMNVADSMSLLVYVMTQPFPVIQVALIVATAVLKEKRKKLVGPVGRRKERWMYNA